jgi:glycosyltransferase involved in cell wall biosynthesis
VTSIDQVTFLAANVPWFGSHSGETAMLPHLARLTKLKTIIPKESLPRRCIGKLYSAFHGWPPRNQYISFSELHAWMLYRSSKNSVLHLLRSEAHCPFLSLWDKVPKNIISTIHLPVGLWPEEYQKAVARLSSAIVYFTSEMEKIGSLMKEPNVKFIHDGADTDFFKPASSRPQGPPRILYGGVYLRNEAMLVRILRRLMEKNSEVQFDLLVPKHHRNSPALAPLLGHPAVTWHAGLNDEQLRALYQNSYLMLLPMNDSGANTSVVEALASGLPVATTDVGGIRDYGGGAVYPVVANNDDDAMIALVEQYLSKANWRDETSLKCRQFAEVTLDWQLVAQKHVQAYREVAS